MPSHLGPSLQDVCDWLDRRESWTGEVECAMCEAVHVPGECEEKQEITMNQNSIDNIPIGKCGKCGGIVSDASRAGRTLTRLAAKACEALRRHRENGSVTLRALADDLGLSPSDLSAITYDGRADGKAPGFVRLRRLPADGKAPGFVRLRATEFRLIEPEEKKGGAE